MKSFYIRIESVGPPLTFKVEHVNDMNRFHRFVVVGRNKSIVLSKNLDLAVPWALEKGPEPRTDAGKLHLQYIYDALDRYLGDRWRNKNAR